MIMVMMVKVMVRVLITMIMVMMAKVFIEKMSSKVLEGEVSENIIEESNGCPRQEITDKQFHTNSTEKPLTE